MAIKPTPGSDPAQYDGTYIVFRYYGETSKSGKTHVWEVQTTDGTPLGQVKWFGRWRKYSFFPHAMTLYEEVCLREIAEFLEMVTKEQRTGI